MEIRDEVSEATRSQRDKMEVGENISRVRREKDITQEELAKRIGYGMTGNSVSCFENGRGNMRMTTFFEFSNALNVTPNELCPRRLVLETPLEHYRDLNYDNRAVIGQFIVILLNLQKGNVQGTLD